MPVAALAAAVMMAAGPCSWAQQPAHVLVVGPLDNYGALVGAVLEGLHAAGFTDTAKIRFDVRNTHSPEEAKAAIAAAVDAGVSAIVTVFGPATQAAHAATTAVPTVFCPVADPLAARLIASNEAPGGNLTGVASADAEASRRRLAAFREVLPRLKRLAVLFDAKFPPDRVQLQNLAQIAPASGITLVSRALDDESAAAAALSALSASDADAILILKDELLRSAGDDLKRAATEQKLPLLVGDPDLVTFAGVVAAVGPNQQDLGRTCGRITARILKGAKPADLPIEHPAFELLINLKAAQRLGLVVPQRALDQAARVIR